MRTKFEYFGEDKTLPKDERVRKVWITITEKNKDKLEKTIDFVERERWRNMKPILKYPGAKWNLAEWIVSQLPPHKVYLEPYFGSGAVFFNKKLSKIETINDIDSDVINFFKVIREKPKELEYLIEYTPWAREEYYNSYEKTDNNLENARRFLVRCWQSFGSRTYSKTGWRHSTTKAGPCMTSQWKDVPKRIKQVADRLKDAQIENMDALELIDKYNNEDVLIYADPPYLLSTRSGKLYKHEMREKDHIELLMLLKKHKGLVIISGYDNELYNNMLSDWNKKHKKTVTEKAGIKTEVIWTNFKSQQIDLLSLK